jgi:glycosyltransferase involved in cell wall biosynthesis
VPSARCSTSWPPTRAPALLAAATAAAPGTELRLVPPASSWLGTVLNHRRAFRDLGLDLLQVTLANPFASRPALLAGLSLRLPTVAVEQLVLPARRRRGRLMKRLTARALAASVSVGGRSADDLGAYFGIPRTAVTVIHNGVPDEAVTAVEVGPRPAIGCAARLEDQKRLDLLLAAVASLPSVHVVLVGDGSRREDLARQAETLGIADRVQFVGWVDDARPYVAGLDAFVLPSRDESFPLTIVEAMLAGTTVVATDVGSVSEAVIDGQTGLLVPPGNVAALTNAIARVLDEPGLSSRLAAGARALAQERFTATAMARAYDQLWREILARP